MNRWLAKALKRAKTFEAFNQDVSRKLRWYGIPVTWTLKELREFYDYYKGR